MEFYGGGLTYTEAQEVPIPELLRLNDMMGFISKKRKT